DAERERVRQDDARGRRLIVDRAAERSGDTREVRVAAEVEDDRASVREPEGEHVGDRLDLDAAVAADAPRRRAELARAERAVRQRDVALEIDDRRLDLDAAADAHRSDAPRERRVQLVGRERRVRDERSTLPPRGPPN